jgi:hypothetical protein
MSFHRHILHVDDRLNTSDLVLSRKETHFLDPSTSNAFPDLTFTLTNSWITISKSPLADSASIRGCDKSMKVYWLEPFWCSVKFSKEFICCRPRS